MLFAPETAAVKSKPYARQRHTHRRRTPVALTVSVPAAVPPVAGWNITAALQLAPAARLPVQVFCVSPNGPLTEAPASPIAKLLVLLIVTGSAELD